MKDGIMRQHFVFSLLEVWTDIRHLYALWKQKVGAVWRCFPWEVLVRSVESGVINNSQFSEETGLRDHGSPSSVNHCSFSSWLLVYFCLFVLFFKRMVGAHLEIQPSLMAPFIFFNLLSPRFESPRAKSLLTCWVCSKTNRSLFTRMERQSSEGRRLLPPRASFRSGETWPPSPGLWR